MRSSPAVLLLCAVVSWFGGLAKAALEPNAPPPPPAAAAPAMNVDAEYAARWPPDVEVWRCEGCDPGLPMLPLRPGSGAGTRATGPLRGGAEVAESAGEPGGAPAGAWLIRPCGNACVGIALEGCGGPVVSAHKPCGPVCKVRMNLIGRTPLYMRYEGIRMA